MRGTRGIITDLKPVYVLHANSARNASLQGSAASGKIDQIVFILRIIAENRGGPVARTTRGPVPAARAHKYADGVIDEK